MSLSSNDYETTQIGQDYLEYIYQNIAVSATPQTTLAQTSGEILYPSITKLLQHISITDQDVFVDLGSGRGKIAFQVLLTHCVKKIMAIEIRRDLHQQAIQAWQRMQHDLSDCLSSLPSIELLLGDFLKIPLTDATIALINATCFGHQLLAQLADIIEATPSIHTVLSLRPLANLQRLTCQKIITVQCSWDSALCYVYRTSLKKSTANRKLRSATTA